MGEEKETLGSFAGIQVGSPASAPVSSTDRIVEKISKSSAGCKELHMELGVKDTARYVPACVQY